MTGTPAWGMERAVLGGLLLDAAQVVELQGVLTDDVWHRPQHAALWRLLVSMAAKGRPIDVATVADTISGDEAQYGGVAYVLGLPTACNSVEHISAYAERVREHSLRRRLQLACVAIEAELKEGVLDTAEQLDSAESKILAITASTPAAEYEIAGPVADRQLDAIRERANRPGALRGLSTGFVDLDHKLSGLQPTDLIIVAARPAMGKTALAMQMAWHVARSGVGVGIFSLEMSSGQLMERAMSMESRVDAGRVRNGSIGADEWRRLCGARADLGGRPVYISDRPGLTITELRGMARRMRSQHPELGLIVVDYLQLMQGQGGAREQRETTISAISRGLKILAKELNVPVVALSQLNRALEARTDKRPLPSDLRESGAIEQDADIILFIYRDEVYDPDSADKGLAEIIIAKQRSGPTGTVKLAWLGQYTMFQNLASAEEVPGGYF